MINITFSLIIFLITVLTHALVHRLLKKLGIMTFKTTAVFLAGWLVNAWVNLNFSPPEHLLSFNLDSLATLPLPTSAIFIFALWSVSYILLFISPFLGDLSPSFKILALVEKRGQMSKEQILQCFSEQKLIYNRLDNLVEQNLVKKHQSTYYILPKGKWLNQAISLYRNLLGWDPGS